MKINELFTWNVAKLPISKTRTYAWTVRSPNGWPPFHSAKLSTGNFRCKTGKSSTIWMTIILKRHQNYAFECVHCTVCATRQKCNFVHIITLCAIRQMCVLTKNGSIQELCMNVPFRNIRLMLTLIERKFYTYILHVRTLTSHVHANPTHYTYSICVSIWAAHVLVNQFTDDHVRCECSDKFSRKISIFHESTKNSSTKLR